MADSDEDSNFRRDREKFTRERYGTEKRTKPDRFDISDRRSDVGRNFDNSRHYAPLTSRRDFHDNRKRPFRDYDKEKRDGSNLRENYSPSFKRFRSSTGGHGEDRKSHFSSSSYNSSEPSEFSKLECDKFKLRSFKEFIMGQDEDVEEETAVKKYKEYKSLFHKSKISTFFVNHQAEEWMMIKYHPRYCKEFRLRRIRNIKKRLAVFIKLLDCKAFENISASFADKNILALLNAASQLMDDQELPMLQSGKIGNDTESEATTAHARTVADEADDSEEHSTIYDDKDVASKLSSLKDSVHSSTSGSIDFSKLVDAVITKSLFVRNYPVFCKRKTLEQKLKLIPGYLRIAISEPSPRRKFSQRAWITFKKDTDVKAACIAVNDDIKGDDAELYAIVNQEPPRKIRPIDSVSSSKAAVRHDLSLACHLIRELDRAMSLYRGWSSGEFSINSLSEKSIELTVGACTEAAATASLSDATAMTDEQQTRHPIEANIFEFSSDEDVESMVNSLPDRNPLWELPLMKDLNCEAFEKTPISDDQLSKSDLLPCEDQKLLKALDLCILYLRVVHSLDFYVMVTYSNEHDMPQRCGVINVRGTVVASQPESPVDKVVAWINERKQKVHMITNPDCLKLSDEEVITLGIKNREEEKKKFFDMNTVKLANDKWLCTLSGKKFRGPEFVEKHIRIKHTDKVEKILEEVEYFNNYLRDGAKPSVPLEFCPIGSNSSGNGASFHSPSFSYHNGGNNAQSRNSVTKSSADNRKIVSYSDRESASVDGLDFF